MVEIVQSDIPVDEHGRQYWHLGCKRMDLSFNQYEIDFLR
jgi:hypothetical protein